MEELDQAVLQMFSLVSDALAGSTQVFLTPDREAARALIERDQLIDALHYRVEHDVLNELIDPRHRVLGVAGCVDPGGRMAASG